VAENKLRLLKKAGAVLHELSDRHIICGIIIAAMKPRIKIIFAVTSSAPPQQVLALQHALAPMPHRSGARTRLTPPREIPNLPCCRMTPAAAPCATHRPLDADVLRFQPLSGVCRMTLATWPMSPPA